MALAWAAMKPGSGEGTLILAAAPIGRPEDASASLAAALAAAPVIAAEDTRRVPRLARALGVTFTGRLVSYYETVEAERGPALLAALAAGQDVLLITDAGTPGISDPGYRLVKAAVEAGIRVSVLAGPSAVTAALAVSGLPSDRFCFEGFPPRKAGDRARRLAALREEPRTMVFFESPRRLAVTLKEMAAAFGPGRPAAVCRELTKTHEEIRRGPLGELAAWAAARRAWRDHRRGGRSNEGRGGRRRFDDRQGRRASRGGRAVRTDPQGRRRSSRRRDRPASA